MGVPLNGSGPVEGGDLKWLQSVREDLLVSLNSLTRRLTLTIVIRPTWVQAMFVTFTLSLTYRDLSTHGLTLGQMLRTSGE